MGNPFLTPQIWAAGKYPYCSLALLGPETSKQTVKTSGQSLYMAIFGSIQMNPIISQPSYKGTILQRNYRNISWLFSYNSFVKFHGRKIWEPQHDPVISNSVL